MKLISKCLPTGVSVVVALLLVASWGASARADWLTADEAMFAVLYEGNGQQLQYNNSNLTGNIGIGAIDGTSGQFQGNGPGTITGTVEFNNSTGTFSNSGLTITGNGGNPLFSQSNIDTDLTALNTLSQNLKGETGTALAITAGGSVNVTSGTMDASGNYVFTVSSVSLGNGQTFTINGTSSQNVVFNIDFAPAFNGQIILTGGITADDVLFNIDAGNYSTQSGGDTLTISQSCSDPSCASTGIYLDPNGNIMINHSVLDGWLYGGDTQNFSIVSGATVNVPPSGTPEPSSLMLMGIGLLGLGLVLRTRNGASDTPASSERWPVAHA